MSESVAAEEKKIKEYEKKRFSIPINTFDPFVFLIIANYSSLIENFDVTQFFFTRCRR